MRAIGATRHLPVDHPGFLTEFDAPFPEPREHDVVVRIRAIAVNPVDTKIRRSLGEGPHDPPRILGWDAAGIVEAVGPKAAGAFAPGDEVYYAGDLTRPGCNAEFQSPDLARQGEILTKTAALHTAGALPPIHTRVHDGLTVEHLRLAHTAMEKSTAIGKWVITL